MLTSGARFLPSSTVPLKCVCVCVNLCASTIQWLGGSDSERLGYYSLYISLFFWNIPSRNSLHSYWKWPIESSVENHIQMVTETIAMLVYQRANPIKTLQHHFPMVFLWFSYGFVLVGLWTVEFPVSVKGNNYRRNPVKSWENLCLWFPVSRFSLKKSQPLESSLITLNYHH